MPFQRLDVAHHPEQLLAHHAPEREDRWIGELYMALVAIVALAVVAAVVAMIVL